MRPLFRLIVVSSLGSSFAASRMLQDSVGLFHRAQEAGPCGTVEPPAGLIQAIQELQVKEQASRLRPRDVTALNVNVHFHIVSSEANESLITDETIKDQWEILRDTYAKYDINFHWDGTSSRTVDNQLANAASAPSTDEEIAHKKAWLSSVRKGGYDDLNLYFYTDMLYGYWGLCTFPEPGVNVSFEDDVFRQDGCTINAGALPGGPNAAVSGGITAVYEVGHWFGLFHVFEGFSCDGPGDYVDDTRASAYATLGCPAEKNTCPELGGVDPIHNFMDYTDDKCLWEFTDGQKVRMHSIWNSLRSSTRQEVV